MSTSVYYKDAKLIDVNNNTKTLLTAGKYLEDDVILTDVTVHQTHTVTLTNSGADYSAYIVHNGVKYYSSDDVIDVYDGDTINIILQYGNANRLYVNEEVIASGYINYTYTVTSDVEISFYLSFGTSDIRLTEISDIQALSVTENGTYTASGTTRGYSPVTVNVPNPSTSSLTVTPTESQQTFNATGVYGYKPVTVNGISSTYVGSGIPTKDILSDADYDRFDTYGEIGVPSGYYSSSGTIYIGMGDHIAPSISFSSTTGAVTATHYQLTGYVPTTITNPTSSAYTLTTQAAQTLYPSTTDQTIASYRWLTGSQTIKSVTTSNLTAENIAEGVVVKVGDTNNASRITQITGTHSGGKTYTATISGSGHTTYCYVRHNSTKYYTNGDTFTFKEGDTITFYTRAGDLVIDDIRITLSSYSYSYTASDKDISIVLSYTNSSTNSIEVFPSKYIGYITSTINDYCKVRYNSTDYKDALSSFSFKKGESVTVYAYDGVNAGTDIYLNGTLVANAVESGSTTYTFTPNESFDICWTDTAAYIATYKVYTCTIGTLSANGNTIIYKNKYRRSNTSFQFKAGEFCTLEIYGTMGGAYIYEDEVEIGTCDHLKPYTYILPAHDISISTSGSGAATCKINSKRKVSIIEEGIQWVSYVKYNNTYYYTIGEFEVFNGETIQLYCGNGNINNYIYVNGEQVNDSSNSSYTYTVSEDVDIQLSTQQGATGKLYANEHIVPSDTLSITSNGTYNVYGYSSASVNVPIPSGYIQPTGTSTITENGIYDITNYASASVSVPLPSALAFPTTTSGTRVGNIIANLYATSLNQFLNIPKGYNSSSQAYVMYGVNTVNLTASNIAEGVTVKIGDQLDASRILQVTGTYQGGGGDFTADDIAMRSISGDISGDATIISDHAFTYCSRLTTASFPRAKTIADYAFYRCSRLTTVSCPSVTSIGNSAFYSCLALTTASFPSATSIGTFAFYRCLSLTTASIPNATFISDYAFYLCSALTTASFPNASFIGGYAFANCSSLSAISFPSVTSIGSSAFAYCSALTTISFPNATSIMTDAFRECYSLTTASFPNATYIGTYAFRSCYSLSTISFPNVTSIGSYAFINCSALTTASFPSATSIGSYAFSNCRSLTTANFPSATYIVGDAFYNCRSLTTVSFPNVTSIGNYAFFYCISLTTVSFPSATNIVSYAFTSCFNLLSFYLLGSSVPTLGISVFYSTPIGGYTTSTGGVYGSIFVPSSLYDQYIVATNWSAYSSRIVSV